WGPLPPVAAATRNFSGAVIPSTAAFRSLHARCGNPGTVAKEHNCRQAGCHGMNKISQQTNGYHATTSTKAFHDT
ncbi:hypothetical protein, partial [Salmonella sp. s58408]|uniref:hypothetical protein n=1 Tax=Salmonella sp. s58408 TaxID=3159701 RepID=UPI003980DBE9